MFQIKMKYMVDSGNSDWSNKRQNVHLSMAFDVRAHKLAITHKSGIPGSILASDDCLCEGSHVLAVFTPVGGLAMINRS